MSVSRALKRDYKYLSKAEAQRIRKLAEEMGYSLNPYLSSWMRNVRQRRPVHGGEVIALIFRNWDDLRYSIPFTEGGNRFAITMGYRVEAFCLCDYPAPEVLLRTLRSRGIRGLIISLQGEAALPPQIHEFSMVWGHHPPEGESADFTDHDYYEGMALACRKLTEYGYRRIAYWAVALIPAHWRWEAAYRFHQCDIPAEDRLPVLRNYGEAHAEWDEWIKRHRPDAMICPHPGWHVPRAMALLEPLGIPWVCLGVRPEWQVAGVDQHMEAQGVAAVRMVTRKMELNETGLPEQPRGTIVQSTWRDGPTVPRKKEHPRGRMLLEKPGD